MRWIALLGLLVAACGGSEGTGGVALDRGATWQTCGSCPSDLSCSAGHCVFLAPNSAFPYGCPDESRPMQLDSAIICTPECTAHYETQGTTVVAVDDCPNGMHCYGGICFPPR